MNEEYFDHLKDIMLDQTLPVIMLGDFNIATLE